MPKFYGAIGYGVTVETSPGVWEDQIIEKTYSGDLVKNTRSLKEGEGLNNDLSVRNSISVVADAYANNHFHNIRYIQWSGARWTISEVDVQPPRLLFRLGEVYNGPGPTEPPESP